MNAFKPLFVAASLVAGLGTVPLFAQDPQQPSMSAEGMNRVEVAAKIRTVRKDAKMIILQTSEIPGHTGADMQLAYMVEDEALLSKLDDGQKVMAQVVITDKGPTVESIRLIGEGETPSAPSGSVTTTTPPATTDNSATTGSSATVGSSATAGSSATTPPSTLDNSATPPAATTDSNRTTPPSTTETPVKPDTQANNGTPANPDAAQRDEMKGNKTGEPATTDTRVHFTGKISGIKTESKQITITPDSGTSIPSGTSSLTYTVPDSAQLSVFHEGDIVSGELGTSANGPVVESVQIGNGTPEESSSSKTDANQSGTVTPDSTQKNPTPTDPHQQKYPN